MTTSGLTPGRLGLGRLRDFSHGLVGFCSICLGGFATRGLLARGRLGLAGRGLAFVVRSIRRFSAVGQRRAFGLARPRRLGFRLASLFRRHRGNLLVSDQGTTSDLGSGPAPRSRDLRTQSARCVSHAGNDGYTGEAWKQESTGGWPRTRLSRTDWPSPVDGIDRPWKSSRSKSSWAVSPCI